MVRTKREARRSRDPEATREALLRAATELFALKGFDGVRIEEIARAADVNKALISYYFEGKRGLYRAAIESSFVELEHLTETLADRSRAPIDLLRGFVAGFAELAMKRRPHFPALFLREMLASGEAAPEAVAHVPEILRRFRQVIRRGVAEGSVRKVDARELYLLLVGSLAFFFATAPAREAVKQRIPAASVPPSSYVAFLQDVLDRILTPSPTGENS